MEHSRSKASSIARRLKALAVALPLPLLHPVSWTWLFLPKLICSKTDLRLIIIISQLILNPKLKPLWLLYMILISVQWLEVLLYTPINKRFWIIELINSTGKFGRLRTQSEGREVWSSSSITFLWIEQLNVGTGNPTSRFTWNFNL